MRSEEKWRQGHHRSVNKVGLRSLGSNWSFLYLTMDSNADNATTVSGIFSI